MSRAARIRRGPIAADVLGRNFTQVFNASIRDKRLSRRARGLLVELLSHRDGYGVSIEQLIKGGPEGRDAIRSALAELEKYGYLHRERLHDPVTGRFGEAVYVITDMPEGLDLQEPAPWPTDEPDDPETEETRRSDPTSDFPTLAEPTSVNPLHKKTTNYKKNKKTTEDTAPSARSAGDVRRTTTGSSAREDFSGSAATDKTDPAADGAGETAGGGVTTSQPSGGVTSEVPGQRAAGGQQRTPKGKRRRKPSPFSPQVRQQIYAVEALLPPPLLEALAPVMRNGHLPNANRAVTAQALQTRTPEELGARAARRWVAYGYERDHYDGVLRSPLGVVEELLRPTPYCPAADCEDGVDRHTGQPCIPCAERIENRRRARRAGKKVPTARPPRLYRDRQQCDVCDRPFPGNTPDDHICASCRAEMDRATAHVMGLPLDDQPDDLDPPDPYMPAPPSREYRQWRADHAAARNPQFEDHR